MKILRSVANLWRNPLDRMKCDTVGFDPLPIEIWQKIFFMVPTTSEDVSDGLLNSQISTNLFYSEDIEDFFSNQSGTEGHLTLKSRLSIVLVCRSWYFMGLPVLWSHLKLKEVDRSRNLIAIYKFLERNPIMASYVTRLTIVAFSAPHGGDVTIKYRRHTEKILQLFPNINSISCPSHLAKYVPPTMKVDIAVVHANVDANAYNTFWLSTFLVQTYFWHHCHTLCITIRKYMSLPWDQSHPITFPRLVNLRVSVNLRTTVQWICLAWNLPVIKRLSIFSNNFDDWYQLIQRVRTSVESLQLSIRTRFELPDGGLEAPALREIHLLAFSPARGRKSWNRVIKAPRLHRVVHYVDPRFENRIQAHTILVNTIRNVCRTYGSVKMIDIVFQKPEWAYLNFAREKAIIRSGDLTEWCTRGLIVNVVVAEGDDTHIFEARLDDSGQVVCGIPTLIA